MKSKVRYSVYSIAVTCLVVALLVTGLLFTRIDVTGFYVILAALCFISATGVWYAPLSVSVTGDAVMQHSLFKTRVFPLEEIEYARLWQPTMGAIRICGSGGFMGHWGLFREHGIGRYMAYYGKASDCFLLRLKDGRSIMLGCEAPDAVVACINKQI